MVWMYVSIDMVYYICHHMDPIFSRERVITFLEVVLGCDRVHSKPSQVWIRGGLAFGIHLTYTLAVLRAEKHTSTRKWLRFGCTRLSRWKMSRLFSRRPPRLSRQHRLITFRVFHFKLSDCHAHWRDNYNYYTWAHSLCHQLCSGRGRMYSLPAVQGGWPTWQLRHDRDLGNSGYFLTRDDNAMQIRI